LQLFRLFLLLNATPQEIQAQQDATQSDYDSPDDAGDADQSSSDSDEYVPTSPTPDVDEY
jgi:hypothetical protein